MSHKKCMTNWEIMQKIISYIGFANKSRQLLVGQSLIKSYKNDIYLILLDESASENLESLAKNSAGKHNCELIKVKDLAKLTNILDVKIVALTSESLAKAIINNKENIIG